MHEKRKAEGERKIKRDIHGRKEWWRGKSTERETETVRNTERERPK